MTDLGKLCDRLNSDASLREEFMKSPAAMLEKEGLVLSPKMQGQLEKAVAELRKKRATVPGSSVGGPSVAGGIGININIPI